MSDEVQIVLAYYILAIKSWFYLRILRRARNQCLLILWPMRVGDLYLENCRLYIRATLNVAGNTTIVGCAIRR